MVGPAGVGRKSFAASRGPSAAREICDEILAFKAVSR